MNIVLIGPRGVGKTKIARRLSYILKLPLFQIDELIVYELNGLKIPEIVSKNGWRYFREIEYKVIKKTSKLDNIIIDCGGGVVVDLDQNDNEFFSERKTNELKKNGIIFYLDDDIKKLKKKIKKDSNRPLLSTKKDFLEIMEARTPYYAKIANYKIDMKEKSKKDVINEIIKFYEKKLIK